MKLSSVGTALCLTLGVAAAACAPPPAAKTRLPTALEASCSACHYGDTRLLLDESSMRERLLGYRSGQLPGLVMPRIAAALSDPEIDALAAAFGVSASEIAP